MSNTLEKDTTTKLFENFNEAASTLGLDKDEQKRVLGLIQPKTIVTPEWIISGSIDAQARARSIIEIAENLQALSESLNKDINTLKNEFFSSHENMVDYLSENYDHSERSGQISSAVSALKHSKG